MTLATFRLSELSYGEVVLGVIIAWVLVALWQRVVENTAYTGLRLDPKSPFHALLVACVMTAIFFVLLTSVNSLASTFLTGDTQAPAPIQGQVNTSSFNPSSMNHRTSRAPWIYSGK